MWPPVSYRFVDPCGARCAIAAVAHYTNLPESQVFCCFGGSLCSRTLGSSARKSRSKTLGPAIPSLARNLSAAASQLTRLPMIISRRSGVWRSRPVFLLRLNGSNPAASEHMPFRGFQSTM